MYQLNKWLMIRKGRTTNGIFILILFLATGIYSCIPESCDQKIFNTISLNTPHHRAKLKHKKMKFDRQLKTDKVIMPCTTINNLITVMDDKTMS
jgi:hypothetical protein